MRVTFEHQVLDTHLGAQLLLVGGVAVLVDDEVIRANFLQLGHKIQHARTARDHGLFYRGHRLHHEQAFLLVVHRRPALQFEHRPVRAQGHIEVAVACRSLKKLHMPTVQQVKTPAHESLLGHAVSSA